MKKLQNLKIKMQEFAFTKVSEVDKNIFEKYKSAVESLGMMLYTNGLVSTLAFYQGKNTREYNVLYENIEEWLTNDDSIVNNLIPVLSDDSTFFKRILAIDDARSLMLITKEVIKLSDALKEMVKAEHQ